MQHKLYLRGAEAERLILYFNGWAMTPEAVEHLNLPSGYDLLVLWDYRTLEWELDLSAYKRISLVAWSMGVWAVGRLRSILQSLPLERAVAVCGTGYPMDDRWGIPTAVFEATLQSITEENRLRFNRRMCGGKSLRHLFEALAQRTTDEIRDELQAVYDSEQECVHTALDTRVIDWSLAHVGLEDRIIPASNQEAYWQMQGIPCRMHQAPHYIFGQMTHWSELWS
ncbi:MAG: DUF452 family protein [Porphyromonadaceae bacterium]|nr:DUF452 family protein [Porphyromonadaceae bacterium]